MRSVGTARRAAVFLAAIVVVGSTASVASGGGPADRFSATPLTPSGTIVGDLDKAARSADGRVAVVVKLAASVASYEGGIKGLAATNPKARGKTKLELNSKAVTDYLKYLDGRQNDFAVQLAKTSRGATVTNRLSLVVGGVSALVAEADLAAVAALPGVESIYPDVPAQPLTNVSTGFIGAPTVWGDLGGQESAGEGVVVGVLDTGIWPEHPSYSDPDPSGKPYAAPPPPPIGTRSCQFSGGANPGAAFSCNNKLIGAQRFMATYDVVLGLLPAEFTSARDDDGHGTHTSSTAAGNAGVAASIFGISRGTISGVAPRAHVIMYKVCGNQGCFGSDTSAAVQESIRDGVDVINYSISGGASPFSDATELAFLDAYNAGVFVSASAGNSGPGADTTDHRGPWVMTVAASSTNRFFMSDLSLTAGNGDTLTVSGASITEAWTGSRPVVFGTSVGTNSLCTTAIPAASLTGQVVVCERGPSRILKSRNVFLGGGGGMILYNAFPFFIGTDNHWVPSVHLEGGPSATFLAFMAGHTGVTATMTQSTPTAVKGDTVTAFSSRGGPGQSLGVSKPDITAPGVQILAGNTPSPATVAGGPSGQLFQSIAGTSMSSPHIAGSGALIKALHPTWTPGQIKSALMTTASTANLTKEDGVTPFDAFDAGAGRVDLNNAGSPGITFSSSGAQFVALRNNLWDANYPSVYYPNMPGIATVNRTAADVLGANSKWTVKTSTSASDFTITTPKKLDVSANGSTTFSITMDASMVPLGQVRFGTITFDQTGPGHRSLHMPVTIVRNQAAVTFTKNCAPSTLTAGALTHCTLTATNPSFNDANVSIVDKLPPKLKLQTGSIVGGSAQGKDTVVANGTIPANEPPNVSIAIAPGSSPAGYLPLSLFGIAPIAGVGDDTITNFNVPGFSFGGETWTSLGVSSNGYLVVGGGSGPDNSLDNQNFPNPTRPNNVLAAFWTDLNPASIGAIRIGTLTDGADTWIVVDWAGVREFSTASKTHSFEIWIGITGDANPGEDITIAYGANTGNGDLGFLSVGAENKFGNRGNNTYFDGAGTLPINGMELLVTSVPGAVHSMTVTFDAKAGSDTGPWTNCATLQSNLFAGTSYACSSGTIQ